MPNSIQFAENQQEMAVFLRHRDKFMILLRSGAFNVQSGKIEINVNNGLFQNVFVNKQAYRRENKVIHRVEETKR